VTTVKQGDHVKMVVTALDRDHGFKLEAFDIDQRLKKGEPTTIEFTADKAGTFPFPHSDFSLSRDEMPTGPNLSRGGLDPCRSS
jgi:nitrous-oxide reductase